MSPLRGASGVGVGVQVRTTVKSHTEGQGRSQVKAGAGEQHCPWTREEVQLGWGLCPPPAQRLGGCHQSQAAGATHLAVRIL